MQNLSVTKSNNLIDASYNLNTQAQKLILACIAKCDSRESIPGKVTITALEFSELTGIPQENAYRDLYRAADTLFKSSIVLKNDTEETEIYWVQEKVKKIKGEGAVTLTWSNSVLVYISELRTRFTSYKIRNIAPLRGAHSIRLYELLMRFQSTGERIINLEDFKASLGISGKYKEFKFMNRDVIAPAIKELNERSNIQVSFKAIKKGRSVSSLLFEFKEKTDFLPIS